jgi:hypothetical protein
LKGEFESGNHDYIIILALKSFEDKYGRYYQQDKNEKEQIEMF